MIGVPLDTVLKVRRRPADGSRTPIDLSVLLVKGGVLVRLVFKTMLKVSRRVTNSLLVSSIDRRGRACALI